MPALTILCLLKSWYGPNSCGFVGPNNETVFVPNAIAKCKVPVSLETNKSKSFSIDGSSSMHDFPHRLIINSESSNPLQNFSANLISYLVDPSRTNLKLVFVLM